MAQIFWSGWVGVTVIIMQVSVQIGLDWNWPNGTELGKIYINIDVENIKAKIL